MLLSPHDVRTKVSQIKKKFQSKNTQFFLSMVERSEITLYVFDIPKLLKKVRWSLVRLDSTTKPVLEHEGNQFPMQGNFVSRFVLILITELARVQIFCKMYFDPKFQFLGLYRHFSWVHQPVVCSSRAINFRARTPK